MNLKNATLMIRKTLIVIFLMACASYSHAQQANVESVKFGSATVELGNTTIEVEYADDQTRRSRGLMYRKSMCANCGMLFKFDYVRKRSMWMKNTFIPLDVAFVKGDGIITDIKAMQPHDLTSIGSSQRISYALEMNQGWFKKHGIKVGDKITITKLESAD